MQHIARAHIEHPCSRCRGEGLRCYNNGSGWRGGVSFAKPTRYRGANRAAVSELAALLHKIDEGRVVTLHQALGWHLSREHHATWRIKLATRDTAPALAAMERVGQAALAMALREWEGV